MINAEGGAEETVASVIVTTWRKFEQVSSVVCGRGVSLKVGGPCTSAM